MRFRDRQDAGRFLSQLVADYKQENPFVLGLPRGGLPVAAEVARSLQAPLDVWVARKLGAPFQPEFGFGAIAPGARYVDPRSVNMLGLSESEIEAIVARESEELRRRERVYRGNRAAPDLSGFSVIVVDDGLATGVTARAALLSIRKHHPRKLIFAAPVCAPDSARALSDYADDVICAMMPESFQAVGLWYSDFRQTTDEEVLQILKEFSPGERPSAEQVEEEVLVETDAIRLAGDLVIPKNPVGLVIFAHGSGSSRKSSRNRYVAGALNEQGLATLLFDLLTPEEEALDRYTAEYRFDIPRLSRRMVGAVDWARKKDGLEDLSIGLFGASTGAAAALIAAAERPGAVQAVVSRGGRPDLAGDFLYEVKAPTLLVVGGDDDVVIGLNASAAEKLSCEKEVHIVPGATHLFEEPGTLEKAAEAAADWFVDRLAGGLPASAGQPKLRDERRAL